MTALVVHPQTTPLRGRVPVSSDRGITHRALVLSALCNGFSTLRAYGFDEDTGRTRACLEALGVDIEVSREEKSLRVRGVGLYGLVPPKAPLSCGLSRPTLMLLAGLLAPQDFESELLAEGVLGRTPVQNLVAPLRERGALVSARGRGPARGDATTPLLIGALKEETYLRRLEWHGPQADADLKGALLLSGLFAHGETLVREGALSPDHLERLFFSLDVPVRASGPIVLLDTAGWSGSISGFDMTLPGDFSAAAALVTAGAVVPESHVEVRNVGTNVARTGFSEALREMGARYTQVARSETFGEVVSDLAVEHGELRPLALGGERAVRAAADISALAVLAACTEGTSHLRDLEQIADPPSIETLAELLRAFGLDATASADRALTIRGTRGPLKAANVRSGGDPSRAMAAILLALRAEGPTRVDDVDCIRRVFPKFVGTLRSLGARIEVAP